MPAFLIGVLIATVALKTFGSPGLYGLLGAIQGLFAMMVLWAILVLIWPGIFFHMRTLGVALLVGLVVGGFHGATNQNR